MCAARQQGQCCEKWSVLMTIESPFQASPAPAAKAPYASLSTSGQHEHKYTTDSPAEILSPTNHPTPKVLTVNIHNNKKVCTCA